MSGQSECAWMEKNESRPKHPKWFSHLCAVEIMRQHVRSGASFYTEPGSYILLDGGTITIILQAVLGLLGAVVGKHDRYARYITRKADNGG